MVISEPLVRCRAVPQRDKWPDVDTPLGNCMRMDPANDLLKAVREQFIVSITDQEGTILEVNDAFCRISRYSREELVGSTHRLVNSATHPRPFFVDMWRQISAGQSWRGEICNRASDGSLYWVDSVITPLRDESGRIERYLSVRSDIGVRKQVEYSLKRQARQHALLAQFGHFALEDPPLEELLSRAVEVATDGLKVKLCRLLMASQDDVTLVPVASLGWDEASLQQTVFDAAIETQNRFAIGTRESIVIADFAAQTRFLPSPMLATNQVRSAVEVLICGSGGSYGVIGAYAREPNRFGIESSDFLQSISNTLAAAIDRKHASDRLTQMAQFDELTKLPNRTLYLERLAQTLLEAERGNRSVGVLFVDVDRFKYVNDTYGHAMGDVLLVALADRLRSTLRRGDTLGRFGGDEFAVVLADLAQAEDAAVVARKIIDALVAPFQLSGHEAYVSASIGVSVFPMDGVEPDVLLKNADSAMYRAKEGGRNAYQFYLPEFNDRTAGRLRCESRLRGALGRNEFLLHYQPKIDLLSGQISGMEALLRWRTAEGNLVPPSEFIAILEDTGMIVPIGEWVIQTVCRQIAQWQAEGLGAFPVAVNTSPRQFRMKNLANTIEDIVKASGIDPGLLELELTESSLMTDADATVQTLREIKRLGIRVSVDDFGTGYSCLAYLKRFPLDTLKIDREFVRDVTSDAEGATIALAIINLSRSLGLKVIAEGVETEGQMNFLRAHGCDEMQGFYFSRPLPVDDMTRALRERRGIDFSAAAR